eukprot:7157255-Pyramimonas_sp.AAC.1
MSVAVQWATGPSTIFSDCQGCVDFAQLPWHEMCSGKRMYSGMAQHLKDHWPNVQVEKVKAHLDVSDVTDDRDRYLRQGNDWADKTATEAVLLHPMPSAAELKGLDRE